MAKRKNASANDGELDVSRTPKRGGRRLSNSSGRLRNLEKAATLGVSKREDDQLSDFVEEEPNVEDMEAAEEEEEEELKESGAEMGSADAAPRRRTGVSKAKVGEDDCCFLGEPVPLKDARRRWPHRYLDAGTKRGLDNEVLTAKCHYLKAKVDDCVYDLYDNAYVKAGEGEDDYICRIVELFETPDNKLIFTARWFFRAKDTLMKTQSLSQEEERRVFLSDEIDDNDLNCIVSKVQIARVGPNIRLSSKMNVMPQCELYYDMSYSPKFSTFANLSPEEGMTGAETPSTLSSESDSDLSKAKTEIDSEVSLLDLYSGCGAMSTGLCHGAHLSGLKLQTRWAVDLSPYACESLKKNHPNAEVRNEKAEDFLSLLHEWDKLCRKFSVMNEDFSFQDGNASDEESEDLPTIPPEEFEVGKIVGICYGETENLNKHGLKFKVRWKGYGPDDDTWEPADGLSKCQERIHDFVRSGYRNNILPRPGIVDVICGGPPCQGVSGFNRFRNVEAPLDDPKNYQLKVFMDTVDYLKPKYVLMENVVDILKFAKGYLGRYALSRLVNMNYQARLGILAAGSFGLPQCRFRAFLWGAYRTKNLPQFPLPTHEIVYRGCLPTEFEPNLVPFKRSPDHILEKALFLEDAISDLPKVTNDEERDEINYENPLKTDFQRFIRLSKEELLNISPTEENPCQNDTLFDHKPLKLKLDDFLRVCEIPKMKGANFRNLTGVIVGPDKVVKLDPSVPRALLPSGKPLVPDYALSFVKGKSVKPFGRLWWDETIATVVTRAEPHNQALLHPEQDRVLTVRENARIQGFPDFYKLYGPVKERYIQVGNAVAVPVARALGYALGLAHQGKGSEQPTLKLPPKFPRIRIVEGDIESVQDEL